MTITRATIDNLRKRAESAYLSGYHGGVSRIGDVADRLPPDTRPGAPHETLYEEIGRRARGHEDDLLAAALMRIRNMQTGRPLCTHSYETIREMMARDGVRPYAMVASPVLAEECAAIADAAGITGLCLEELIEIDDGKTWYMLGAKDGKRAVLAWRAGYPDSPQLWMNDVHDADLAEMNVQAPVYTAQRKAFIDAVERGETPDPQRLPSSAFLDNGERRPHVRFGVTMRCATIFAIGPQVYACKPSAS